MIKQFLDEMRANRLSDVTIKNNSRVLEKLDKFKPVSQITKTELQTYFSGLKLSENNYRTHQIIIRHFLNKIGRPEIVEWMKIITPKETLKSDDILTTNEINDMIDATDSIYYKAFIAFLFETGCRFSEAHNIKWGDFIETTEGMIINIKTTKTAAGYRKVILPFSTQYIRNLKAHVDAKKNSEVFHVKNKQSNDMLHQIAGIAKIKKPISCHKMRHAQCTDMVKRSYNEAIIRKKLGWSPTSAMIARYQHLSNEDVINATLENTGKLPQTAAPRVEIKEAERMSLVDAAMQFSKLSEDNETLKAKISEMEEQRKKDMDKITRFLEMGRMEILKKEIKQKGINSINSNY